MNSYAIAMILVILGIVIYTVSVGRSIMQYKRKMRDSDKARNAIALSWDIQRSTPVIIVGGQRYMDADDEQVSTRLGEAMFAAYDRYDMGDSYKPLFDRVRSAHYAGEQLRSSMRGLRLSIGGRQITRDVINTLIREYAIENGISWKACA